MEWLIGFAGSHLAELVLTLLLVVSELLAYIPQVKANSVFQFVVGVLKWAKEKIMPAKIESK